MARNPNVQWVSHITIFANMAKPNQTTGVQLQRSTKKYNLGDQAGPTSFVSTHGERDKKKKPAFETNLNLVAETVEIISKSVQSQV